MTMRVFALAAFFAHLLFGNMCMMPMASAAEPHHAAMAAGMKHDMAAMSHAPSHDDGKGMPCDGGHCLTHALPASTSVSATVQGDAAMLPAAFEVIAPPVASETPLPVSAAPPGQYIRVDTIVLRN